MGDAKEELRALRSTIEGIPALDEEGRQAVSMLNQLADTLERLTQGLEKDIETHKDD